MWMRDSYEYETQLRKQKWDFSVSSTEFQIPSQLPFTCDTRRLNMDVKRVLRNQSIACTKCAMKISSEHSVSQFAVYQQVSELWRSSPTVNVSNGTDRYPWRNCLAFRSHHLHHCRYSDHSFATCSEYRLQSSLLLFPSSGEPPCVLENF